MKHQQASATAKVIAASTVLLANEPTTAALIPPGAAELCTAFLSDGPGDRLLCASARSRAARPLWRALEKLTHPGITHHYWHRKSWIEQRCRHALAHGVTRVVVIGAGFDTLAMRLAPDFPSVAWIEVDHPATQAQKRRGLAHSRLELPANLDFIGADLATDPAWVQRLGPSDRAVLVIAEGLLMYLPPDRVHQLLADHLPRLAGADLWVLFSYMVRWPAGPGGFRPSSRLVEAWLRRKQEPFTWLMAPEAASEWLDAMSYEIVEHRQSPFVRPGLDPGPFTGLQGENLIEARRILPARHRLDTAETKR